MFFSPKQSLARIKAFFQVSMAVYTINCTVHCVQCTVEGGRGNFVVKHDFREHVVKVFDCAKFKFVFLQSLNKN